MNVLAMDLGGTKLSAGFLNDDGNLSKRQLNLVSNKKGKEVGMVISSKIITMLDIAEKENLEVDAIGICVPGIVNAKTMRVWAPNIPGWEDYPLLDEIKVVLGNHRIPVVIDNDRACYLTGELWKGAAIGCHDAIFLAIGTGIGAGIISNNNIIRGNNDIAGSIGWMGIKETFDDKYRKSGCFEYYASGEGLVNLTKEIIAVESSYNGELKGVQFNARDIFQAYERKDQVALIVIKKAISFWGIATANLISIFNPEKIIFGGGVFGPGSTFLNEIENEARKWAQPISMTHVHIVSAQLGNDAGLFGAGFLATKFGKSSQA